MKEAIVWFAGAAAAAAVTTATLAIPPGPSTVDKRVTSGNYTNARHCLELPSSEAITRCAQRYM